jgi:hypothetical protein
MAKPTAQQLLERIQQINADAETLKELWLESFPPGLPLPPDWEIKNAVRRLALADLLEGIYSYTVRISKGESNPTSQKAMKYICGAAWTITEKENPDQEFHPTARRTRNAEKKAQQ